VRLRLLNVDLMISLKVTTSFDVHHRWFGYLIRLRCKMATIFIRVGAVGAEARLILVKLSRRGGSTPNAREFLSGGI